MDSAFSIIHGITLKTIHPAFEKGVAYRVQRVAQFISAQNVVNAAIGDKPNGDNTVLTVCNIHNSDVPVRSTSELSPAPLLHFNTSSSGLGNGDE